MFRDFYRMADELHKAVEPIRARRRAKWDELMKSFKVITETVKVEWVYEFTIKTHGKDHLDFQI